MKSKFYIILTMLLACALQVKGADTNVEIGTLTNAGDRYGFAEMYNNFSSQTLYLSDEINKSGYITKLSFKILTKSGKTVSSSLKIYLGETTQTSMPTAKMDVSTMTSVYNSTTTLGNATDGWETITLTVPYYYDGTKNLIVGIETSKSDTTFVKYSVEKMSTSKMVYSFSSSMTGWSPTTVWYRTLTRFTFSESTVNVNVGDGTSTIQNYGFGDNSNYFASQTLYSKEEIGQTGDIKSISFAATDQSSSSTGTLKIYMAEVDQESLTSPIESSKMKCVYSSTSATFGNVSGGYKTVALTSPFHYTGNGNLVVAIQSSKTTTVTVKYKYYTKSGRYLRNASSTTAVTPFDSGLSSGRYIPITRFSFGVANTTHYYIDYGNKVIGEDESYSNGFYTYYRYFGSQTLYLASDLKRSGYINKMSFEVTKNTSGSTGVTKKVRVWLGEIASDTLSNFNKLTESQMTKVYDGNVTIGDKTGEVTITFSTYFMYSGRRNLVVAVESNALTSSDSQPDVYFKGKKEMTKRAISKNSSTDSSITPFYSSMSSNGFVPNIHFQGIYHPYSSYTSDCIGICDRCGKILQYALQLPPSNRITHVTHLKALARAVTQGAYNRSAYYLMNDIDLSGSDWLPIGSSISPFSSCSFYGYNPDTKEGHTISGLSSNQYLFGGLGTNGNLYSVRLANGNLVKTGTSGKISSCLTLGSALFGSRTSTMIDSSFYVSSSANTVGGRTLDQMKSGAVTYGLNHAATSVGATYYQTIGSDNYPVFDSSRGTVYRGTKCEKYYYSNTSSNQGKVTPHSWQNAICTACSAEPTTFSQNVTLSDSYAYRRTKDASISSSCKLTYTRTFNNTECWQEMYVPFSFKYDATMASKLDVAEIYAYGVKEDTNHDGNVTSADDKMVTVRTLDVNAVTEPNMPYLIKAKSTGSYTFTSVDGILTKAESNSVIVSTMKEEFMVQGHYTGQTVYPENSGTLLKLNTSAENFTGTSTYTYVNPFRLHYQVRNKNGNYWSGNLPVKITHTDMPTFIIDDESGASYNRTQEITVKNFTYNRDMSATVDKWQPLYVPFDIKLTSEFLAQADFATIDGVTSDGDMDCIVVTKRTENYTIQANTPSVLRIHSATPLELHFDEVVLKPAENKSKKFSTANHTYTFTGVYAPFQTSEFTWYAIAKDGLFHPAKSTAKLPAYRFYLTVDGGGTLSSELRLGFFEQDDEETGILNFGDEASQDAVYTLDGRRVQSETLQPGIYVKNGKKFRVQ